LARAQASLARNEAPVAEAFDGMCLLLAGVLLLTPGFATDTVGLLLFVPAIRHAIMAWLWKRLRESEKFHVYAARTTRGYTDESVIEGEFEEIRRKDGDGPPRPVHPHRIGGDHS
ncbi:MAG: FxsA family protein, partial [Rhodospirillaceae bacterium]|nr:FxsA family protein [Rhodospirillaceae bacterium]